MSVTSVDDVLSYLDTWDTLSQAEQEEIMREYFEAGGTMEALEEAADAQEAENDEENSELKSAYSDVAATDPDDATGQETQLDLLESLQDEIDDNEAENDALEDMKNDAQDVAESFIELNGADYTTSGDLDGSTYHVDAGTSTDSDIFGSDQSEVEALIEMGVIAVDEGVETEGKTLDELIAAGVVTVIKDADGDGFLGQADIDYARIEHQATLDYQYFILTADSDERWQLVRVDPTTGLVTFKKYNINDPEKYAYYEFQLDPNSTTQQFVVQGGYTSADIETVQAIYPIWLLERMSSSGSDKTWDEEIAELNGEETEKTSSTDVIPNYDDISSGLSSAAAQDFWNFLGEYMNDPSKYNHNVAEACDEYFTEKGYTKDQIADILNEVIPVILMDGSAEQVAGLIGTNGGAPYFLAQYTSDNPSTDDLTTILLLTLFTTGGDINMAAQSMFGSETMGYGSYILDENGELDEEALAQALEAIRRVTEDILPSSSGVTVMGNTETIEIWLNGLVGEVTEDTTSTGETETQSGFDYFLSQVSSDTATDVTQNEMRDFIKALEENMNKGMSAEEALKDLLEHSWPSWSDNLEAEDRDDLINNLVKILKSAAESDNPDAVALAEKFLGDPSVVDYMIGVLEKKASSNPFDKDIKSTEEEQYSYLLNL